jgi:hypothetical protein
LMANHMLAKRERALQRKLAHGSFALSRLNTR